MRWTLAEPREALDPDLLAVMDRLEQGAGHTETGSAPDPDCHTETGSAPDPDCHTETGSAPEPAGPEACRQPAVRILAARSWDYPLEKQRVVYQLSRSRKVTALEAFIYRAACLPQGEPVDIAFTADLLGLDPVFVEHASAVLAEAGLLEAKALPAIRFTASGRTALGQGRIVEAGANETLEYCFDRKFGTLYGPVEAGVPEERCPAWTLIEKSVPNLKEYVNRAFIVRAGQAVGRDIEPPDSGQAVSAIVSATVVEPARTRMWELWTWDPESGQIGCHVWDPARQAFHRELSAFIRKTPGAAGLQVRRHAEGGVPDVRWRD